MPSLIINFEVVSQSITEDNSICNLRFNQIIGHSIGGYRIYKSYTPTSKGIYDRIIIDSSAETTVTDAQISTNDGGYTYFNYYVNPEDYGRIIYLSISPVTRYWEELVGCEAISIYNPPNSPETFNMTYDNYSVFANWSPPQGSAGSNVDVSNYILKRANCLLLSSVVLNSSGNLSSSFFTVGSHVFVMDVVKKSCWYGKCLTSGEFILDDLSRFSYIHDDSADYDISINNLKVYLEESFEAITVTPASTLSIEDNTFMKDSLQFYSLTACVGTVEGLPLYYPLFTLSITKISPYLRNVGSSENSYLNSLYWRKLKNVLIDSNYYNKQTFDIPYIKGLYNFKGYLGLYNCKLDVFINGIYSQTVITDFSGSFSFSINLTKSHSTIQLEARDSKNIGFSSRSTPQIIRLVSIYSFFTALAQEYTEIWKEILNQINDFYFTTSRPLLLENKLSPYLGITKDISETDTNFTTFIVQAYLAYEYAGYQQSLYIILDALQATITQFDHYEIFFRDSLMDTLSSGYSYVIPSNQISLERKNYIYGVTSANNVGEESGASIIRVDNRWWPISTTLGTSTGYYGFTTLTWKEEPYATKYNVYRQETSTGVYSNFDFKLLQECLDTVFVDIGKHTPVSKYPPEYTITTFSEPADLKVRPNTHLTNIPISKKNKNWIRIILYQKGITEIPEFQLSRLLILLADIIPPELGYTVILCNDNYSKVLI